VWSLGRVEHFFLNPTHPLGPRRVGLGSRRELDPRVRVGRANPIGLKPDSTVTLISMLPIITFETYIETIAFELTMFQALKWLQMNWQSLCQKTSSKSSFSKSIYATWRTMKAITNANWQSIEARKHVAIKWKC